MRKIKNTNMTDGLNLKLVFYLLERGRAMAQAVSRWPQRPEFVPESIHVGFVVDKVALGQVFLRVLRFSPVTIIPPLLHIHLSPPHEVCDSSQAAHYHHFGPKLGTSFLTRHFGWKQNKKAFPGENSRTVVLRQMKVCAFKDHGHSCKFYLSHCFL
jgi:hypothetical protein